MMGPLQLRQKRQEARRLRTQARNSYDDLLVDELENELIGCLKQTQDYSEALTAFKKVLREKYGFIAEVILFINLAVAILAILEHFGYLSPTPAQFNSIFDDQ